MGRDVTGLLEEVIVLIQQDVEQIKKIAKVEGKLPHLVSQDLCRYSGTLLDLESNLQNKDKEQRSKLSKMTTEELEQLARDVLENKKV